jgi:tetratricopeptide (TPR) repeat protein
VLLVLVVCGFSVKTFYRNQDWKNNYTLFTKDVLTVPNSAMVNNNVSSEFIKKAFTKYSEKDLSTQDSLLIKPVLEQAHQYGSKAIMLNPHYVNAYLNRALANLFLNRLDQAIMDWKKAAELFPGRNAILAKQADYLLQKALRYGINKDYKKAIKLMEAASEMDKFNPAIWNNLGGAYFMVKDYSNALRCFKSALSLNPNLMDAQNGFNAANGILRAVQ